MFSFCDSNVELNIQMLNLLHLSSVFKSSQDISDEGSTAFSHHLTKILLTLGRCFQFTRLLDQTEINTFTASHCPPTTISFLTYAIQLPHNLINELEYTLILDIHFIDGCNSWIKMCMLDTVPSTDSPSVLKICAVLLCQKCWILLYVLDGLIFCPIYVVEKLCPSSRINSFPLQLSWTYITEKSYFCWQSFVFSMSGSKCVNLFEVWSSYPELWIQIYAVSYHHFIRLNKTPSISHIKHLQSNMLYTFIWLQNRQYCTHPQNIK